MPTSREIEDAAKKAPKDRSTAEQQMVDAAKEAGNTTASNLDHQAQETQRFGW